VRLQSPDLTAPKAFYHGLLGMGILHEDEHRIALQRSAGEPCLFLEAGGAAFLMGKLRYMGCASQLRAANVEILQDVTVHGDWKGVEMHIRDPDGNAMQIVQYLD
jgi:hypothetical protein